MENQSATSGSGVLGWEKRISSVTAIALAASEEILMDYDPTWNDGVNQSEIDESVCS